MSELGMIGDLKPAALAIIEPATGIPVPAMIAAAGERASLRFLDSFIDDRAAAESQLS